MIKIKLDNKEISFSGVVTDLMNLKKELFPNEDDIVAAEVDGKLCDLFCCVSGAVKEIEFIRLTDDRALSILRHTGAHIVAQAVLRLYPSAKLAIGPATDDGFYYDIDYDTPFTLEDMERIEKEVKNIVGENLNIQRVEYDYNEAIELMRKMKQEYKIEIINELERDKKVSLYKQGEFIDLCRGPHLPRTGLVKNIKILRITGAYWRGDERNKMLQRIYGTAFPTEEKLNEYLYQLEEAKKRDHRRLGKDLDLFSITDDVGSGLVLWHPKGAIIRMLIENLYKRELMNENYNFLYTPNIANEKLWRISGHLDFYKENMYPPIQLENQNYVVKPMNCPLHIIVYKSTTRSYKELPLRFAELGTVYRYERSGVIQGLFRVRGFTQDDAHIFCTEEQIEDEILKLLKFTVRFLNIFGFDKFKIYLSTMPEKYAGTIENWQKATKALENALKKMELTYQIAPGEGVFYGPKIDVHINDSLGRSWQCSTIQVDFNLPERFELKYMGNDMREHTPIMIHRAIMGSFERFFAILIEHYAGAFPVWLAPIQVVVLSVLPRNAKYALNVYNILKENKIRAEIDLENEPLAGRIRRYSLQKIPYLAVVGQKEEETGTIAIRERAKGDIGAMKIEHFLQSLNEQNVYKLF